MIFDTEFRSDYGEMVNDLQGIIAHYYAPKKLDLNLKINYFLHLNPPLRNHKFWS